MQTTRFLLLSAALGLAVLCGCRQAELAQPIPIEQRSCIRTVYQIKTDDWKEGVGAGLHYLKKLRDAYRKMGIEPDALHMHGVFHGDAAYMLLNDSAYEASEQGSGENPNRALVASLVRSGVHIEICANTMESHGWTEADLLPGVVMVVGAYPRIIDLQLRGYAYIRF